MLLALVDSLPCVATVAANAMGTCMLIIFPPMVHMVVAMQDPATRPEAAAVFQVLQEARNQFTPADHMFLNATHLSSELVRYPLC